ncbi:MAG: SDR family oxidoreductase [Planctomycetes bacterium]|nr:SDR family oxidoreductase [Planctomycetota bacterium]
MFSERMMHDSPGTAKGELAGQVAVVTGAAGAIGRAISTAFLREGARVCLMDNHAERLSDFCRELQAQYSPQEFLACRADVRDTEQVDEAFARAAERFGRIDILVNNAAVTQIRRIDQLGDADIDRIIDVNLKGYFKCARAAARFMLSQETAGVMLFISSKNGLEGCGEKSLYCATKGGELAMARSLARELGPHGIRVNSICPDAVLEGSSLWAMEEYRLGTCRRYNITEEQIPEYYRQRCALRTNMGPADVANAALFLVGPKAAKITGQILVVDGGVSYVR